MTLGAVISEDGATVIPEERFEYEGPPTILELGHERAGANAERAERLARCFDVLANQLRDPTLDPRERHAIADIVADVWLALEHPGAASHTRTAMAFLEAIESAAATRKEGEICRAIAKEQRGFPLADVDQRALRQAPTDLLEKRRAELVAQPELAFTWSSYWDPTPLAQARAEFAVAHSPTAAKIQRDEWNAALDAWERGPGTPRGTGAPPKWEIFAAILSRVHAWPASADQLKDQWRRWREERVGIRSPLNRLRDRLQAARHEQGSQPPAEPRGGAPTD